MARRFLSLCGLALVLALPGLARAGDVRLVIHDGRVDLSAHDATLRQILLEWERVGGTRIINRDRVPGTLLTMELANVTEARALATLLRPIAGYMAAERLDPAGGASQYSRIILMPGEAAPWPSSTALASPSAGPSGMGGGQPGRPSVQRRVLPDGRIVTVMDDSQRPGEADDTEDSSSNLGGAPGMMRPPFQGSGRLQPGQPSADPTLADPQSPQGAAPATKSAPTVPVTIAAPGALPTAKQYPATPPGPPKPPGH